MNKIIKYIKAIIIVLFILIALSVLEKFLLDKYCDFFNGWVCAVIYLLMIQNIEEND